MSAPTKKYVEVFKSEEPTIRPTYEINGILGIGSDEKCVVELPDISYYRRRSPSEKPKVDGNKTTKGLRNNPMNHRRTPLYKLLKRIVWVFWKPYEVLMHRWALGEIIALKWRYVWFKERLAFVPVSTKQDSIDKIFDNVKQAHAWAFENLSITGRIIDK